MLYDLNTFSGSVFYADSGYYISYEYHLIVFD